jgi:tetratricopeptide (TPR) repeat protein
MYWVCLLLTLGSAYAQVDLTGVRDKIANDQLSDAAKELEGMVSQNPKNLDEVYFLLGRIAYMNENYDQARKHFQSGLNAKSKSPLNLAGMGLVEMREGNSAQATELLTQARTLSKGKLPDVEYTAAEAMLLGGTTEIGEAKKILYGMKESDPNNPEPYIKLGDYYKKVGVPELAISDLEAAIKKRPNYYPAYVSLAELKFEEGKATKQAESFNQGFKYANQAIELNANYAPAYRIRAELYLLNQQYDKARDDMRTYVSKTDGDLKARIRYAGLLFLTESYQDCLNELDAIEKAGMVTNVMRRLRAMSLDKTGEKEKALSAIQDYFANVKKEEFLIWQDYEAYGDILRSNGRIEEADGYYAKAIEKNGERVALYGEAAEDYQAEAKAVEKEISALKKKEEAAINAANGHIEKGNAFVREGNNDAAKAEFAMRDEEVARAAGIKAQYQALGAKALQMYENEAHYRDLVIKTAESVSLQNFMKLATSQYNAEQFEPAMASFGKVIELKADYSVPYTYMLRCAYALEQADTTSNAWIVKPVAERIITAFGNVDKAQMDSKTKQNLTISYEVMANYSFNPTGEEGNYNCLEAKPWIEKLYDLEPGYPRIKQLSDYCNSQGGNR